MDKKDRRIIELTAGDIGAALYPYKRLAARAGISEADLLKRIARYRAKGILRRFGAVLRHQRAGFTANGMSVWNVPASKAGSLGKKLSGLKDVSHCYERPRFKDWPYNLYAMIHGKNRNYCLSTVRGIAKRTGIKDYQVLFSTRELKKTSMKYKGR